MITEDQGRRRAAERRARSQQQLRLRRQRGRQHVTVIQITNAKVPGFRARVQNEFRTGAEPWNIVSSPDGKRVFVANSGQDTITVINALNQHIIGHVEPAQQPVQRPRPPAPLPAARPGGEPRQQAAVTSRASCRSPSPAAGRRGRRGRGGRWSAGSNINTSAAGIGGYVPAEVIRLAARPTGFVTIDIPENGRRRRRARRDHGLPEPAAEHRHPRQPGLSAQHRRLAGGPAAVPELDRGLRQPHRRRERRRQTDGGAFNLHLGARDPEPAPRRSCSSPTHGRIAFTTPGRRREGLRRFRPAATCWSSSTSTPRGT